MVLTNEEKKLFDKIELLLKYKKDIGLVRSRSSLAALKRLIKNKFKFNESHRVLIKKILTRYSNKKYVFSFQAVGVRGRWSKYITLKEEEYIDDIVDKLITKYWVSNNKDFVSGSDYIESMFIQGIQNIKIIKWKKPEEKPKGNLFRHRKNKNGKFFKYVNQTVINLERYQIISKDSNINILNEHCLLYAFKLLNVDDSLIKSVKSHMSSIKDLCYISKKDLIKITEIINQPIHLYEMSNTKSNLYNITKFNKSLKKEPLKIGLIHNHYFILDDTEYTKYSIEHYKELNHIKDFRNIFNKSNKKSSTRKRITSLGMIYILFNLGYFIEDPSILNKCVLYNKKKTESLDNLDNIEDEQRLYEYKEKQKEDISVFYADTETMTKGEKHIPLMIGVISDKDILHYKKVKIFENNIQDDGLFFNKFLIHINKKSKGCKKVIIYFHNLKYDYNVLIPYLKLYGSPCEKDGMIYNVKIFGKSQIIEFRDSYKLLSMKLSDFQLSLNLDKYLSKKEAIAYNYYTLNNWSNTNVLISEYEKYLNPKDIYTFKENIEKSEYTKYKKEKGYFNPIEYYKYYLKFDCMVLYAGMNKFKSIIDEITGNKLNIHNFLTISSLTNAYMGANGSFDNLYEVCGSLREFIGKAVTGGRVQVNEKYIKKVINEKIADYDGVSMYPSSISRMCKERGLPTGKCKRLETLKIDDIKKYNYAIMKIKINSINKFQQMPIVSYKKDGIMNYINNLNEPIYSYVDITTLEDWIKYQDIEYDIIDGIYWNNGSNRKFGKCIEYLFNERLKYKKENNEAMQLILKLMMNSAYGKTITKTTNTVNKIIDNKYKQSYVYDNFYTIHTIEELSNGKQTIIKMDHIDSSYNLGHVGVMVLSYAKRIMNEVYDIANDNNINFYYSDTDSIHMPYDKVKLLEQEFKKIYKRELNGKQLGQFHIDFNLKGACSDIYATKSLFLGKKCYIDALESKDENGDIINDYHLRLKGVNTAGLDYAVKDYDNYFSMFEYMSQGNEIEFILNPPNTVSFDFSNNKVSTKKEGTFKRIVKF